MSETIDIPSDEYFVLANFDSQNLYHSCKDCFGFEAKIDYRKLRAVIEDNLSRYSSRVGVKAVVYTVSSRGKNSNDSFVAMLQIAGYLTRTKYVHYLPDQSQASHRTEWNVEISLDTMKQVLGTDQPINRLVLVSNSGAFEPLLKDLNKINIPTDVYGFRGKLSRALSEQADRTFFLDENVLLERKAYGDDRNYGRWREESR